MLLSITKLQNLKAIHNFPIKPYLLPLVVINHKTTKFESNSQRGILWRVLHLSCYQSQNHKIWKQFTTRHNFVVSNSLLLSITKLQNLKAIHNLLLFSYWQISVVINHKTTKFESNSQLASHSTVMPRCCYQSQNYKIWKQFTTFLPKSCRLVTLLSITKLQNLKSNSQLMSKEGVVYTSCYQSQNYKIWKQFTTC